LANFKSGQVLTTQVKPATSQPDILSIIDPSIAHQVLIRQVQLVDFAARKNSYSTPMQSQN
jgi:hypothetical protein